MQALYLKEEENKTFELPTLPVIFFRQEGWRLEHENPADPQTPLVFKGVVFNEMKGAFVSFVNVWFKILYVVKWFKLQVINGRLSISIARDFHSSFMKFKSSVKLTICYLVILNVSLSEVCLHRKEHLVNGLYCRIFF